MCTAIRFNGGLFGRTLDFERSFGEEMIIAPRGSVGLIDLRNRYAVMGIGVMDGGFPLYFDGVNECGLAAAALNFPKYAVYAPPGEGRIEAGRLIATILGLGRSVGEARDMLAGLQICGGSSPLHWIFADVREAVVVESCEDGLRIYDDPVGVLTNSPPFPYHLSRLGDISHLSPTSRSSDYSRGMGAIGLPGDFSSSSRFLRAAFINRHITLPKERNEAVSLAFCALSALSVPPGCVITAEGESAYTRYTSVMDMAAPAYYLTTATCRTVRRVKLTDRLMNGREIVRLSICAEPHFVDI